MKKRVSYIAIAGIALTCHGTSENTCSLMAPGNFPHDLSPHKIAATIERDQRYLI